jgi:hypothetical protein
MARWEGELVRIACGAAGLGVAPATREEAEAWWEQLRPSPVSLPEPDLDFGSMPGLLEMPAATAAERTLGVRRYGAKASNLGTLYQRIDPALRLGPGFAIPMRYYQEHLVAGGFDETIADLLADDELATDGAARRVALAALRESIAAAPCDPELLAAIGDRIGEVFGDPGVMVRFRSSSNAEDALDFSGAGLYSSRSVCLADDLDGDDAGPSRCDPSEAKERGVCSGLKEVWASLWRPQAYNERAWYGIDHSRAAMAILVNPRAAAERANIVAFTGNPLGPDLDRYLVNAQTGELDVVSSRPGVWPEKDLLTIEDARVVAIERVRGSSELEPGDHVLDDLRLRELGAGLVAIAGLFPVDGTPPEGRRVLLDTEWKITADGRLVIKQVRPFIDASR